MAASEQKQKVLSKDQVLFGKVSQIPSQACSEHSPGLRRDLSPLNPQQSKGCAIQERTQILVWKCWSVSSGGADEPLPQELMQGKSAVTHCPHTQHRAWSRMESELSFQPGNPKRQSNTNHGQQEENPHCGKNLCVTSSLAFSSSSNSAP